MKKILISILLCFSIGVASACFSDNAQSSSVENSTPEQSEASSVDSSVESVEESSEVSEESASESWSEDSSESSEEDSSSAGGEEDPNVCKITFVQEGQQTITRYINKGETLIDIPTVQPVAGYDVAWSVTDFSNVQGNIEVTVVKTPKTFKITYKVENGVKISSTVQKVTYLAEYELLTATRVDYQFIGWKIEGESAQFDSKGVYSFTEDIVLVPIWRWIEGEWVE